MTNTPNFNFNLPQSADSMADVADSFNNSFTFMNTLMMGPSRGVVAGSVLPQKVGLASVGDYAVGDTIHLTGWKSNFILVGYQPAPGAGAAYWGYIWRPLHAAWSPWITVPVTAFMDSVNYGPAPENPLLYRTSNKGEFEFSGGAKSLAGAWPKFTGADYHLLTLLPPACSPAFVMAFQIALVNPNLALTNKSAQFAIMIVYPNGDSTVRVMNSSVANDGICNELHFNGVVWPMATRNDLQGTSGPA